MLEQSTIFDAIAAREAAERGIAQASDNKKSLLEFARKVAKEIGRRRGFCHMDLVTQEMFAIHRISPNALGNASGSVFREKCWRWDGEVIHSERVAGHRRLNRIWKFIG